MSRARDIANQGAGTYGSITADDLTVDTSTLVVDEANNRVGIGLTSPDQLLHVKKSNAGNPVTILHNSTGATQEQGQVLELRTERGTGTLGTVPVIRLVGSASTSPFDLFRVDSDGDIYSVVNNSANQLMQQWGCRAWVNFNHVANSIRDSGNVSSITDNGLGDQTVNFTNSFPDNDFAISVFSGNDGGTNVPRAFAPQASFATGSVRFRTFTSDDGSLIDDDVVCVQVVR